jgi:hypothetical protein
MTMRYKILFPMLYMGMSTAAYAQMPLPHEQDGRKVMTKIWDGVFNKIGTKTYKIVSFEKIEGVEKLINGQKVYLMEIRYCLQFPSCRVSGTQGKISQEPEGCLLADLDSLKGLVGQATDPEGCVDGVDNSASVRGFLPFARTERCWRGSDGGCY